MMPVVRVPAHEPAGERVVVSGAELAIGRRYVALSPNRKSKIWT